MAEETPETPAKKSTDEAVGVVMEQVADRVLMTVLKRMQATGDKSKIDELMEEDYKPENYEPLVKRLAQQRADVASRVAAVAAVQKAAVDCSAGMAGWAVAKAADDGTKAPLKHLADFAGFEGEGAAEAIYKDLGLVTTPEIAKTLNISTLDAGGVLTTGDKIDNFFRPLRDESIVLRFNPIQRSIIDGAITVTGLATDVAITWDGEVGTQEIDTEPTWADRARPTHFARALVPISNKALRSRASTQLMRDVNDSLFFAFSNGFDEKWINGTGISYGPKGLRANAGATTNSGGNTFDNIVDDAKGARKRMAINNVRGGRLGWLMSTRDAVELLYLRNTNDNFVFRPEMQNGTWFGVQYEDTNNISTTEGSGTDSFVLLVDFSGVLIGTGTSLNIQSYRGASYTAGGTVYNTAETGETVIVGEAETTLLVAQAQKIEEIDAVGWGA